MSLPSAATVPTPRLYYLDWIRVLAMMSVFFFHNARFFDSFGEWHVKNASTNLGASIIVAFISQWAMPLFFLIAGAGTYYALKTRRAQQFLRDRLLRLMVPLLFGMLVIVVPQAYFQALYQGENLSGYNFLQIYGLYLGSLPGLNTFHLWFLLDLFTISVVTLPLFITLGNRKKSVTNRAFTIIRSPWVLIPLGVLLIVLVNILVYPAGDLGNRNGGWNIVAYLIFFISGYIISADSRIMETVKKHAWIMLGTGVLALAGMTTFFLDEVSNPAAHFGSPSFIAAHFIQSISTWGWLLAILGLGNRYLNFSNRFLKYANEAVLPFYILHQTVIISIGFFVVQWSAGVGLKYLVISTTSFAAIMMLYEVAVRHINAVRFLFGMKANRPEGSGIIASTSSQARTEHAT